MALVAPKYFNCVVAIGCDYLNPKGVIDTQWIATGFLFGYRNNNYEENKYSVYIVTNKHVFKDLERVKLLFNPQDGQPAKSFYLTLVEDGKKLYKEHAKENVDIAVIPINHEFLDQSNIKYDIFFCDKECFLKDQLKDELNATEGDGVFALGYPMGIVGVNRQYVILRNGCLARVRDMLEGNSSDFIIDAMVFPGNSGGPVICKPELVHITGTNITKESRLIGVVKSSLTYRDIAVSPQTKRTRVVFEENTGLTNVEPVDYIIETIEQQ